MNKTIFRKKSLDRISSPEQLSAYLRVSTPSVWLLLSAIVILLVGICVWGMFGHMDTRLPAVTTAQNGVVTAYVREEDTAKVSAGMTVFVDGAQGSVRSIHKQPVPADEALTDYMLHVGGLQEGEWVYALTLDVECADGVYNAQIIIDSVPPMSFVLN